MTPPRSFVIAAAVAATAILAACGSSSSGSHSSRSDTAPPTASSPPGTRPVGPSSPPAPVLPSGSGSARTTTVTKVLVLVIENHSLDEMSREMPFTFSLARAYGYATDFHAIRHPSLPNYLAMTGGSTFGVTDDDPPANHVAQGASVFGQAIERGRTAKLYAEGMPSTCDLQPGGDRYAVKHNPWAYFIDERAECRSHDVSLTSFATDVADGRLPNAGMVIPNTCDDAHDPGCSLADADNWMRTELERVLQGPDFRSGHLAVIVTADEDDRSEGNRILTVVLNRGVQHRIVTTPLTTYSIARLYEQVLGAPLLRQARTAPDMASAFGLRVAER